MYNLLQEGAFTPYQRSVKRKATVCVYDQAIYPKACQIKCKEQEKFQDLFLIMGTFHIISTFLAVISSRFKDVGLRDILIQSSVVAEGSVDTKEQFVHTRSYMKLFLGYSLMTLNWCTQQNAAKYIVLLMV